MNFNEERVLILRSIRETEEKIVKNPKNRVYLTAELSGLHHDLYHLGDTPNKKRRCGDDCKGYLRTENKNKLSKEESEFLKRRNKKIIELANQSDPLKRKTIEEEIKDMFRQYEDMGGRIEHKAICHVFRVDLEMEEDEEDL